MEIAKEMGEKSMKAKYEQQAALGNGAAASGEKAVAAKYVSDGYYVGRDVDVLFWHDSSLYIYHFHCLAPLAICVIRFRPSCARA